MTTFSAPHSQNYTTSPTTPYGAGSETPALSINGFVAALLAAAIIVAFVAFGGDAAADSPATDTPAAVDSIQVYVVQPGDTLWGIASDLAQPGDDVAAIVEVLSDAAGSASLDVGQRIVIDHQELRR